MKSGIYRIDLGGGNFYVGSAQNIERRIAYHRSRLNTRKHYNVRMQRCWDKYGIFEFSVLETCAVDCLIVREQFYLDKYFSNLQNVNIAPKSNSSLGTTHTPEARAKISAARKNRPSFVHTETSKAKISAANKGRIKTEEAKAKISAKNKGKTHSPEARAKMSASWGNGRTGHGFSAEARAKISVANKGRIRSAETRAKMSESSKLAHKVRRQKLLLAKHSDGAPSRD